MCRWCLNMETPSTNITYAYMAYILIKLKNWIKPNLLANHCFHLILDYFKKLPKILPLEKIDFFLHLTTWRGSARSFRLFRWGLIRTNLDTGLSILLGRRFSTGHREFRIRLENCLEERLQTSKYEPLELSHDFPVKLKRVCLCVLELRHRNKTRAANHSLASSQVAIACSAGRCAY